MKKLILYSIMILMVATLSSCNKGGNTSESIVSSNEIKNPKYVNESTIEKGGNIPEKVIPPIETKSPQVDEVTTEKIDNVSDNIIKAIEIKTPKYIDEVTINALKANLQKENEFSFFDKFKTGTILKIEDLKKYKFSVNENEFLDSLKNIDKQEHDTEICLIDIDNDGSDEITISQYQGGTLGIVYFAIFKKDNKGEYSKTVKFDFEKGITFTLNNILNMVMLGKKNYLLVEEINGSDKTFSGISIYSFIDGKFAECTTLDLYSKETYTIEKGSDYSQYMEYLKSINIDDLIKITKKGDLKIGAVEKMQTTDFEYEVDINNDSKNEIIKKRYNQTSTYHSSSALDFEIANSDLKFDGDPLKAITGEFFEHTENRKRLQQFWCDSFNQKNLINIFYRNDFEPIYRLNIYLLEGSKSVKVGWIKATPNINIGEKTFEYSLAPANK